MVDLDTCPQAYEINMYLATVQIAMYYICTVDKVDIPSNKKPMYYTGWFFYCFYYAQIYCEKTLL